ncbi:MAG: hypothetical protein IJ693_00135 [Bacteroidaceae bacterium]|nr:hypothetical protein [Bacteroidaceae bacterium]
MKKLATLMLLVLIVTSTFAQTHETKRTDRLLAASGLPRYRNGKDTNTPFIESFRYEENKEAKRWWTGFYEPKRPRNYWKWENTNRKKIRYNKKLDAYIKKRDKMTAQLPRHGHIFLAKPSFSPSYGFSYSDEDTALVYLEHQWNGNKKHKKVTFNSHKMKVDVAIYDSIQCLHKLAVYTSAYFDPQSIVLDGTSLHFVWSSFKGDKYAVSPDNGFYDSKPLGKTFESICKAIKTDDHELLQSLMPTVQKLLAHYRTLLPPDVPIDDWDLDATARHRQNKK